MKVTLKRLKELRAHLIKEERILASRITVDVLRDLKKRKLCYFHIKKKQIVGFVALWPTVEDHWYELGTMWVHPEFRQLGLSGVIFERVSKLVPEGASTFLITKSRKVAHVARKAKWDKAPLWEKSGNWLSLCRPKGRRDDETSRKFSLGSELFYLISPHH